MDTLYNDQLVRVGNYIFFGFLKIFTFFWLLSVKHEINASKYEIKKSEIGKSWKIEVLSNAKL